MKTIKRILSWLDSLLGRTHTGFYFCWNCEQESDETKDCIHCGAHAPHIGTKDK